MDFKITSENIEHPLLKPVLEELIPVFKQRGITFYLIGAVARDIILELNQEKSQRVTMDLDIAIAVDHWEDFENLSEDIIALPNFTKDAQQKQRFLYKEKFQVDIVPYGGIKDQNDKIYWPPDKSFAMSVIGFEEAEQNLLTIKLDEEITFDIVSLEGVFLLKLFAWKDRFHKTSKDAEDIGFLLNNYFNINRDLSFEEPFNKVYDDDHFTELKAGATILGMKLNKMLNAGSGVKSKVKALLEEELKKEEQSQLFNQITETNRNLNFDDVAEAIHLINEEIN
ncbi:nucleotidyl transferase AbiEii/AbiGii toxin family protein [Chryseobacterium manosquense]|uniref:Nucleotidyl transferase AbiEii/AbiGii toxin family protein n=1 Tax=Chryseobacterium manosquense TaxID=2754694 RepID=A0A7H1DTM0_9FLAO|nr:nucleotidyl transferase AbiEii/AbiGii toxin family protein [Chryseobacterium manosquense]QNS40328.1 nucleotidyl transferase AbiEii/AbiGii toxin family protein [Chryseobacterium manosquense]